MKHSVMHILLEDMKELQRFRFWYINAWNLDLSKESMVYYFNGDYSIPCVVTLNANTTRFKEHQGVHAQGDTWDDFLQSSLNAGYYKNNPVYSLEKFLKMYN